MVMRHSSKTELYLIDVILHELSSCRRPSVKIISESTKCIRRENLLTMQMFKVYKICERHLVVVGVQ